MLSLTGQQELNLHFYNILLYEGKGAHLLLQCLKKQCLYVYTRHQCNGQLLILTNMLSTFDCTDLLQQNQRAQN